MSTSTDELVELDVDLDATIPCGVPQCDREAAYIFVAIPCRHPGRAGCCAEHREAVLVIYRKVCSLHTRLGLIVPCKVCGVPSEAPYAEAVPL